MVTTYTVGSFIGDVRAILRDTVVASQHYTDEVVMNAVVDAFQHLYAVRPESRYNESLAVEDTIFPSIATLSSFSVKLDTRWRVGVVYYAAARCYERDVTDSVNLQMAQGFKQQADAVFAA